jgi:translation initiation factor IF-3
MSESTHKINEMINHAQVILIDQEGVNHGVVPTSQALELAEEVKMDLVLVSSSPPTCKIFDYQKYLYALKKKKKAVKPSAISCIRFGLVTDVHDFQVKIRKVESLLQKGHKVTVMLRCRRRQEVLHINEGGVQVVQRVLDALGDLARIEQAPLVEGRIVKALLAPASGKKKS